MSNEETIDRSDEIAVIGMAGRFPDANNIEEFWANLCGGRESVTFFTDEELLAAGGTDPAMLNDPNYVKAGCILGEVENFDAAFFGYSPREVEIMDPQHRLFLETAWEALEHAGYNPETYPGAISVFGGSSLNKYLLMNIMPNRGIVQQYGGLPLLIGSDKDFLTTRVSYKLNLRGASVNIQTACSTSLVAIHMAAQSLLNGECEMALAGGVSVQVPQQIGYTYVPGGTTSVDGHCRTFDENAQGTVPGSGSAIVLLKRLEDALSAGDTVYAVIKGSAINNDGWQKVGYTAPSVDGQTGAVGEALAIAGIDPATVTYVEAHGTATPLGDPIEIEALTQVFRDSTDKKQFCAVGSVKTNVGHLDAAAGATGFIKTVLSLQHRQLPPSLHYQRPNPKIDFANSPFFVNTELRAWQAEGPLRAGVSSFGIGGTNAHVVLEEAPEQEMGDTSRPWQLLVLSARSEAALEKMTDNLAAHLQKMGQALPDIAHTLQVGRKEFTHRRVLVARDVDDARQALSTRDPKRLLTTVNERQKRPVAFLFGGVGDQYVQMAKEIYETEPTFREQVDHCCDLLKPHLGLDLREVLYPKETGPAQSKPSGGLDLRKMLRRDVAGDSAGNNAGNTSTNKFNQTSIAHPALFVIEYALTKLLQEWGLEPQAMIGHSLGEYVAATLAGVFSLEDALLLVAKRAQMIQALPGGAMLAIPLSEQDIAPMLGEGVWLATVNGPAHCVVSGTTEGIAELEKTLTERGISSIRVQSSHAFHSELLAPIAEEFTRLVASCNPQAPKVPYLSNVTGTWMTAEEATDPSYWARHMCRTVRFGDGVRELCREGKYLLLEVGPGQTLSSFVTLSRLEGDAERVVLPTVRNHFESRSDVAFLLNTLGQLWLNGVEIDWAGFYAHERRLRVPLPTYPFERQRYWIDPPQPGTGEQSANPLGLTFEQGMAVAKTRQPAEMFYAPVWKRSPQTLSAEQLRKRGELQGRKTWLVFADEEQRLSQSLIGHLQEQGQHVITVSQGDSFAKTGESAYRLNPSNRGEYEALIIDLLRGEQLPEQVVHLWSLSAAEMQFEAAQENGLYSLLYLTQALEKAMVTEPLSLSIFSDRLHEIESGDRPQPEKATLLGACKVIPQEYPNLSCRTIEVELPQTGRENEAERLLHQLLAELAAPNYDRTIAYRGRHRLVQAYENVPEPAREEATPTLLRQKGAYLLLGGFGDKGRVFAEYLARTVHARLVLTTRQEISTDRNRFVQHLESLGAEVLVLTAEASDLEQMRAALEAAESHFGTLHGILHSAGLMEQDALTTIGDTGLAECEAHFQARVHGLYVLEKLLQHRALDFCLLTSSITSVLGGIGLVAPAAAHQFMDAFAHRQNATSHTAWLTVNWDRLTADEMSELLPHLFAHDSQAQLVVSKPDLHDSIRRWLHFAAPERTGETGAASQDGAVSIIHARPNLNNAYVAPTNELEQAIAGILQDLLGIDRIGIHDNFFQLGGNSLLGTQVVTRIRNAFRIDIPLRTLFDANTVAQMAVVVEEILIAELEALDDAEVTRLTSR